jgi:hypothetical protein
MVSLLQAYGSTGNKASDDGDEPTPDAALLNAAIDAKIPVEPNKTYLIRILCVGNFPGHAFLFDQQQSSFQSQILQVSSVDAKYCRAFDCILIGDVWE